MDDEQHTTERRGAYGDRTTWVDQVGRGKGGWIRERCDGFLECHAVLSKVRGGFSVVPLEVPQDDRRH